MWAAGLKVRVGKSGESARQAPSQQGGPAAIIRGDKPGSPPPASPKPTAPRSQGTRERTNNICHTETACSGTNPPVAPPLKNEKQGSSLWDGPDPVPVLK